MDELIAGVLFIAFQIIFWWCVGSWQSKKERAAAATIKAKEDENRRLREQEESEWRSRAEKANQETLRLRLSGCITSIELALNQLPQWLKIADKAASKAEEEFEDGAFAPFWDAAESALKALSHFDFTVHEIGEHTSNYANTLPSVTSGDIPTLKAIESLPDARPVANRLKTIVRKAQKHADFAKIYEMRRINSTLASGFTSLGDALDRIGGRIISSISELSQTMDSAITRLQEANDAYHVDSLASMQALRDMVAHSVENEAADAVSRRTHEAIVEERLDNIQRRKRPYIEHFRDGQY